MKKTGVVQKLICTIMAILLISVPVYASQETDYNMPVSNGCHSLDAQISMLKPSKEIANLYSAILYDYKTETLVYSVNPDDVYDPGNLVKIMAGLMIAERGNMDDQVTVDGNLIDLLPEYSDGIDLQDGEVISLRDLLYCMIIGSANDAALIAADHVGGSLYAFLQDMNSYAIELGCTNTFFTNITGGEDSLQFTTARDLAKILAKAVENDAFMDAFTTVHYSVPATNKSDARGVASNNYFINDDVMSIYLDERVTGGCSSIVDDGKRNLAVSAEQDGVALISIVLGGVSQIANDGYSVISYGGYPETRTLLNLGFQGHYSCQIFYENQVLNQFEVSNGDNYLSTGVKNSVSALLPSGVKHSDLNYRYSTTKVQAPIKAGDKVATVEVWYGSLCLAVTDLYAMHDVKVKEYVEPERIVEEPVSNTPTGLIVVITTVCLLVILLFGRNVIFRLIRKIKIRHIKNTRRRKR